MSVINFFAAATIMVFLIKTHKINKRNFRAMNNKIKHLYMLSDLLSNIAPTPIQLLFEKVRKKGPDIDLNKMQYEISRESYERGRKQLKELIDKAPDFETKSNLEKMLEEVEGMYNLYSTLDEDSSPEYIKRVMDDLHASMLKIASLKRGGSDDYSSR